MVQCLSNPNGPTQKEIVYCWELLQIQMRERSRSLQSLASRIILSSKNDVTRAHSLLMLISLLETELAMLLGFPILILDAVCLLSTIGWKVLHLVNVGLLSYSFASLFLFLVGILDRAVQEETDSFNPPRFYLRQFGSLSNVIYQIESLLVNPMRVCIDVLKSKEDNLCIIKQQWMNGNDNNFSVEHENLAMRLERQLSGHIFIDPVFISFMNVSSLDRSILIIEIYEKC